MSGHASRGDLTAVRTDISSSLRSIGMFIVFSAVALSVVALPFARVYESDFANARAMSAVILAFLPGLILFSMLFIIQRVFYALGDTRTPFFMQCVQSGLFIIGALLTAVLLPGDLIGVGIAAVTSIAGSAQAVVSIVIVRRRLSGIEGALVIRRHLQYLGLALVAGAVGLLATWLLGGYSAHGFAQSGRLAAIVSIAVAGVVMAVIYFGLLLATRNPELSAVKTTVLSRFRRKR
jgi:putative peptidoglycan lipid II flippase